MYAFRHRWHTAHWEKPTTSPREFRSSWPHLWPNIAHIHVSRRITLLQPNRSYPPPSPLAQLATDRLRCIPDRNADHAYSASNPSRIEDIHRHPHHQRHCSVWGINPTTPPHIRRDLYPKPGSGHAHYRHEHRGRADRLACHSVPSSAFRRSASAPCDQRSS